MTYIMIAPNGARRTKVDHIHIPVTDSELISESKRCFDLGVQGVHAHIRTDNQTHLLDRTRYEILLKRFQQELPEIDIQVTSEAADIYKSEAQITFLGQLSAPWVSLAIREIIRHQSIDTLKPFFANLLAKSRVQFIIYDSEDFQMLLDLTRNQVLVTDKIEVLYVLGRYSENQESYPTDLDSFLIFKDKLRENERPVTEMVCAFGIGQINCLVHAAAHGLNIRVGFENGIWLPDGSVAETNADLVIALRDALQV